MLVLISVTIAVNKIIHVKTIVVGTVQIILGRGNQGLLQYIQH